MPHAGMSYGKKAPMRAPMRIPNAKTIANLTAGMGRMGDTEILHVRRNEIPKIQKALGVDGTRNPQSGYLEFWTSGDDAAAAGGGVGVGGEGGGVPGDTGGTSAGGVTDGGGSGNAATDAAEATGAVGIDPGPGVTGPGVGQSQAATQAAEETGAIGIDPGPGVSPGPSNNATAPGPASGGGIQGLINGLLTPQSIARSVLGLMMGGPVSPGMANAIAQVVGQGLNSTIGATNEGAVAAQGVVGEGGVPGVGSPDDNFASMLSNPALGGLLVGMNGMGAVAPGGSGGGGGAAGGGGVQGAGQTNTDIQRFRNFLRQGLRIV